MARPCIVDRDIGATKAGFQHSFILGPERLKSCRQQAGKCAAPVEEVSRSNQKSLSLVYNGRVQKITNLGAPVETGKE
jgi:hypothetical protein